MMGYQKGGSAAGGHGRDGGYDDWAALIGGAPCSWACALGTRSLAGGVG